jgi:hypothetical protein
MIGALLIFWGGVITVTAIQNNIHQKQTDVAFYATVANTPAIALQLTPTFTPKPINTPKPTNTPKSTPTIYMPLPTIDPELWIDIYAPYQSRLDIGDEAYVSESLESSGIVYDNPYLASDKIGQIYPGEKVRIVGGPSSSSGLVWWIIESLKTGLVGWTAEGDKNSYWLIPVVKNQSYLDKWAACHASYQSRLEVSDKANVSTSSDLPNRVREGPYLTSDIVGRIYPGEEVIIIEGPSCSNDMVWWKIRSIDTGLIGWTSEGEKRTYWLVPLP